MKVIAIIGPTASGKSDLAIKLAKKFNGEIISADSRQVYKSLDIGTGKVIRDKSQKSNLKNQKERELYSGGVRHYLLDVASPRKQFTAADFKLLGGKAIAEVYINGKIPIIVGGTGFYIDILLGRSGMADVPPNPELRAKLEKQSAEQLFTQLKKLDPRRAGNIDRYNKRRLIRALEVALASKKVARLPKTPYPYEVLWIGIKVSKSELEKKIKDRLDKRFRSGMLAEGKRMLKKLGYKRLYDLGLEYRWMAQYLRGEISKTEMQNGLYRAILQYSKRQMTWFKRNGEINWVPNSSGATKIIRKFLG